MTISPVQGLSTSLATSLSAAAAMALHLDNPWWAAISAWIISHPEHSALLTKGVLRVIGTILGSVLGYHLALATAGQTIIQMMLLALSISLATYGRFTMTHGYAWAMTFVLIALLIVVSITNPTDLSDFAVYRMYEIVTGVVIATAVSAAFAPHHRAHAETSAKAASASGGADKPDEKAVLAAAIFGGVVSVLIVAIWQLYDIPSSTQVFISVFAVLYPSLAMTKQKMVQRFAGCILGGCVGLAVASLAIQSFMLWWLLLFVGLYALSFLHTGGGPNAYVGTQAGLAYIMAMVTGFGPPDTIMPALDRVTGIWLAILVLGVCATLVSPWAAKLQAKSAPQGQKAV